jgi:hypothetical protein
VSPVTDGLLRSSGCKRWSFNRRFSGRLYSFLQVWHEPEVPINASQSSARRCTRSPRRASRLRGEDRRTRRGCHGHAFHLSSRTRRSSSLTYTTQPLKHTDPLCVGRALDGAMLSLISSLPSQPPPTVALLAGKEWPSRCNTPFGICARVKLSGRGTGRFMVRSQFARLWRAGFLLSGDFGSLHGRLGPCACGPDVNVRMPCGAEN